MGLLKVLKSENHPSNCGIVAIKQRDYHHSICEIDPYCRGPKYAATRRVAKYVASLDYAKLYSNVNMIEEEQRRLT